MRVLLVLVIALGAASAQARPQYVSLFPNGSKIDGQGCQNCHNSPQGGDARNPFGQAESGSGFSWSAICGLDSDGDGQTNGEELGDPDCVWTTGAAARTSAVSNPGRAASTSTDPLGGAAHSDNIVARTCPANATSIVTGCRCDDGFSPSADGSACDAATGVGTTWMCDPTWDGDGSCDCGCGAHDSDCADNLAATCQYNDCDFWQATAGLQTDTTDPTQCAGGTKSQSPGGSIAGSCPDHATAGDNGACACDSGFTAAATSCTGADEGEGEGEGATQDPHGSAGSGCTNTGGAAAPLSAAALVLFLRRARRRDG